MIPRALIGSSEVHVVLMMTLMLCAAWSGVHVRVSAFSSCSKSVVTARHTGTFSSSFSFTTTTTTQCQLWRSQNLEVYSFTFRGINNGLKRRFVLPRCYSLQNQSTNEELGESKLGKKAARKRSKLADKERNLKLKELLSNKSSGVDENGVAFKIPSLYAVKLSVCKELRDELKMNGREKRGRIFIELGSDGSKTLKGLKMELHSFFRSLRKSTFILSAALPEVGEDGSILAPADEDGYNAYPGNLQYWDISHDDDVLKLFEKVHAFADKHPLMKRPSVFIHVQKDPNAPAPPPPPKYLEKMNDPSQTESMTMLSFYAFPPPLLEKDYGIENPEEFAILLFKLWKPFGALGRVYVAREGVNAQMAIPTNV